MAKGSRAKKLGVLILSCVIVLSVFLPASVFAASRENDYPIVLCHGNGGWGRDELIGFKYWGGTIDLEEELDCAGYTTYTAVVGPFSSNWDRACELYAYIKGGTVDYGKAHSKKFCHARYGKTYSGLYTEWGDLIDDKINKIHLIAHSQGGQTTRMLIQLLEQGSPDEQAVSTEDLSPLFSGGKSWVASLTTLDSPHDGTTLSDINTDKMKNLAKQAIASAGAAAGLTNELIYDFKLDQWGLKWNDGECFLRYADRVWNSPVWDKCNKDFSFWDLSTDGAVAENKWVQACPDVYYFSYASYATRKDPITRRQIPNLLHMNPHCQANAILMGRYTRNKVGRVKIDSSWWRNDGWVNTISENGPKIGSKDIIVDYDGTAQIGKWNFIDTLHNVDHEGIVGRFGDVTDLFLEIAQRVSNLPALD